MQSGIRWGLTGRGLPVGRERERERVSARGQRRRAGGSGKGLGEREWCSAAEREKKRWRARETEREGWGDEREGERREKGRDGRRKMHQRTYTSLLCPRAFPPPHLTRALLLLAGLPAPPAFIGVGWGAAWLLGLPHVGLTMRGIRPAGCRGFPLSSLLVGILGSAATTLRPSSASVASLSRRASPAAGLRMVAGSAAGLLRSSPLTRPGCPAMRAQIELGSWNPKMSSSLAGRNSRAPRSTEGSSIKVLANLSPQVKLSHTETYSANATSPSDTHLEVNPSLVGNRSCWTRLKIRLLWVC